MIKSTLPNKSGNPESLEKLLEQLESSSTNAHTVGEDLLRAFYNFCVSSDQWKISVANILQGIWERFLYENNRNYSSRNVATNLLSLLLCPLIETKNKNQIFSKLVVC